ncbi:hypothetical protein [Paramaledivibacter caminithermalis]|uniref:Uncharacterized protein n=1 Tax=Paramaledivibacter caminithermalis (strain DSM 15212 / CIP 107654 / DViRD3) TaxID=1121301 RepID=A0A1M6K585_PARC5|nr:hypothetical protein [Paramaledivibacter caminithermalis]SHJ54136.1 hypothetical protein SAMN02745912_00269 [Paramaledivibacter caminithermalis DSM 15212]
MKVISKAMIKALKPLAFIVSSVYVLIICLGNYGGSIEFIANVLDMYTVEMFELILFYYLLISCGQLLIELIKEIKSIYISKKLGNKLIS